MGESRNEDILLSIINGTAYTTVPQSRIEDLLLQVKQVIEESGADTYTKAEIDNLLSAVVQEIDWKESVATFSDLATTYPDAEDGWTASVLDTDDIYRYNGTAWVNIYRLPPLATSLSAGLMSSGDKDKLDTIERGANKTIVDASLSASSENPVQNKVINSALSGKVDKENGKGLSSNDFTTAEKTKLSGIESGAQVNVQSDWNVTTTTSDAYIKNKPSSLPANGGNADTVGHYSADNIVKTKMTKWFTEDEEQLNANVVCAATGVYSNSKWLNTPSEAGILAVFGRKNNFPSDYNWPAAAQLFQTAFDANLYYRYITNDGTETGAMDLTQSWRTILDTGNCPIDIDEGEEIGDKWVSKNYAKFANGLCVQWGSASDITSGYTFTFPYAFSDVPSVCVNRGIVDSITTGGFTMIADSAASDDTIYYTAIGYIS